MPVVSSEPPSVAKCWLSVLQAAEYLSCSANFIRGLLHRGDLKATQIGTLYRIEKVDLDQLLRRRKRVVPPYRTGTHPWVKKSKPWLKRGKKQGAR